MSRKPLSKRTHPKPKAVFDYLIWTKQNSPL
jgi:hypothetical protein